MKKTMGVKRSTLFTLSAGVLIAGASFAGLQRLPVAHAQTRLPAFTPRTISITESDDLSALDKADKATADLVQFVEPGVVDIVSEAGMSRDLTGRAVPGGGGEGSGVIYRPDGYIITNDHVVGGFDKVTVILQDGRQLPGKVIRAQDMDLAVVKVDAKDLPTLPFADSTTVRPGEFSMAVGSPFGLTNSVTFGHISAISRTNNILDDRLGIHREYGDMLQTDTPINMGNSGGPLLNVHGEVIGINTAIYSPTGNYNGIGFAIPSNTVRYVADKLITDGKLSRGALGLAPATLEPYKAKEMGLPGGAKVVRIVNGTPAAMAGIKLNDIVVRVGNLAIKNESDVRDSMMNYSPGETIPVEVVRDGQHKTFQVKLTSPDKLPQPVAPQVQQPQPDLQNPFGPGFKVPNLGDPNPFGNGNGSDNSVPPTNRTGNAKLGVTVGDLTPTLREQFHIPAAAGGAIVTSVSPGSAADKLGIQPGDVIQGLGGKQIDSAQALKDAMQSKKWGEQCSLKFTRYGDHMVSSEDLPFTF